MKKKLMIIGASGHGKVVLDIALKMNAWNTVEFLDKNPSILECLGFKVSFDQNQYEQYLEDYDFFVAIGNNAIREKVLSELERLKANIVTLVHPDAVVGIDVHIQKGTVIMGGVVINPSTVIGKGCIINTGSTIDHDNHISDFTHISPGSHLAGSVRVGKNCWLGIGSIISNNITITSDVTLGAGAVVISDIDNKGTYVGCPVRRLNS